MVRCLATTLKNRRCKKHCMIGKSYCNVHVDQEVCSPVEQSLSPVDTEPEVVQPIVAPVVAPVIPPVTKIEIFEINPWDDDDIWEQIIEVAHKGPEAFADGLDWVALCTNVFHKGAAQFVFHKSLAKEHVLCIIMNSGPIYDAFVDQNKQLNVLMTVI